MKLLSPILAQVDPGRVQFFCPGCRESHTINIDAGAGRPCWGYNSNPDAPTFTPSVLVRSGHHVPGWSAPTCYCQPDENGEDWGFRCYVCHSFVTDGRIQFLGDCTHDLAGQTVDLPAFPEAHRP